MTLQQLLRTELASRRRAHYSTTRRTTEISAADQAMIAKYHAKKDKARYASQGKRQDVPGFKLKVFKHGNLWYLEDPQGSTIGGNHRTKRAAIQYAQDNYGNDPGYTESVRESVSGTIWKQISSQTKMAVGARNAVGGGNKIHFNVGRGKKNKIEVVYNSGQDLYTVNLWEFSRGMMDQKIVDSMDGVYADMLDNVIYRMVNK